MDKLFSNETERKLKSIIKLYESKIGKMEEEAQKSEDRAYGGVLRAGKGSLVELIARELIEIAWIELGEKSNRLSFEKKYIKIPVKREYIERIRSEEVKEYIKEHIKDFYYPLRTDIHVHIDRKFKMAVECKAYTENAMLKRILVDFTLLKQVHPELSFVLFQLESQLGGDYSSENKYGSPSTHTLLSYFDIDLNIITLLEGERKVDKPIHKREYYKPLKKEKLIHAIEVFKSLLQ
jgi:hypothetical protein